MLPQHVPDVYFVRRSPKHLDQFLEYDKNEMSVLMAVVTPEQKRSFEMFKIEEKDREILNKRLAYEKQC